MTFKHKVSTRHPMDWVMGPVAIFFGALIALGFGVFIIDDGFEWGVLLALTISLASIAVGLNCIYRIIVPKEYTTIISDDMIICKTNDDITYQVKKEDIKMISIYEGHIDSVYIEMKSNEKSPFPFAGRLNLSTFREELLLYEYPVD